MRTEDMWITMTFIQLAEAVLDPQLMHEHPYGELPVCCVHELSTSNPVCNESWATVGPSQSLTLPLSLGHGSPILTPNPRSVRRSLPHSPSPTQAPSLPN
jgi:hypothetical protein